SYTSVVTGHHAQSLYTRLKIIFDDPTYARQAFPCLDEPDRKAKFEISLVVLDHLVALSNMVTPTNSRNYVKITFDQSPVMSTYLVAMVIGHFDHSSVEDANGVKIRVFTPVGKAHYGYHALRMAKSALPFYADLFGTKFPLPKLDLIAIPDFSMGAMENWGLITYRETSLLIDAAKSSLQSKRNVARTVSHELAHMWFGNLVTMEWWTHLWLNEGFATFIEYLAVDHCFPEYDIWVSSIILPVMCDFCTSLKLSLWVPVNSPSEVEEIFDAVSYEKGASIIRMLRDYIGPENFKSGLQLYISRHMYSNTVTEDLWQALSEVCNRPIADIMSSWTKRTGFPVLSVRPATNCTGSHYHLAIEQLRFLADGTHGGECQFLLIGLMNVSWPLLPLLLTSHLNGEIAPLGQFGVWEGGGRGVGRFFGPPDRAACTVAVQIPARALKWTLRHNGKYMFPNQIREHRSDSDRQPGNSRDVNTSVATTVHTLVNNCERGRTARYAEWRQQIRTIRTRAMTAIIPTSKH
ncbi:unnamed protein product, partial [Schistocephalus solidus]|uniref:Peptidase_M1 domain-containing protein n=1 Tax=Schistocephalus solidus TaxID=70667 RepID=A0A183TCJ1_SCHSO